MAKKKEELNSGHYSQFADRTDCIKYMIQGLLIVNPVADEIHGFRDTLGKIKDLLNDLSEESKSRITETEGNNFDLRDRAYCFYCMTEELLIADKGLAKDKKGKAFAQSAANRFWHLYQHLEAPLWSPKK